MRSPATVGFSTMKQNQKNHKTDDEGGTPGPSDCILCAAGGSNRMGLWKPLLPWKDGVVIDAAVAAALGANCRVILVTGYRGEELEARFRGTPGVFTVRNPDWQRGMVSSILAGARYVERESFFVSHADMPLIPPGVYRSLRERADQDRRRAEGPGRPGAWRFIFQGKPGHPVLFERSALPLIEQIGQGESLKAVFDLCELRTQETDEPGVLIDFDDTEAYLRSLLVWGGKNNTPGMGEKEFFAGPAEPTEAPEPVVEIITGPQGAGKTTALRLRLYGALVDRQPLCGVYQRQTGRNADGISRGFELEALSYSSGTSVDYVRRLLCVQATDPLLKRYRETGFAPSEALGPFLFDPSAFQSALDLVHRFLTVKAERGRVFYIDELGKLELERSGGLRPLLEVMVRSIQEDNRRGLGSRLVCSARQDTLPLLRTLLAHWGLPFAVTTLTPRETPLPRLSNPRTAGRSGETGR
jgi:molybdenum cofactor cytidylyltransferase